MPVDNNNIEFKILRDILQYACNFTLGRLWATQPIALLNWPPLKGKYSCKRKSLI